MSSIFSIYFKTNLLLRILIGLILGAICGIIFQDPHGTTDAIAFFKPFGDIFIRLLKMIVLPVIVCSLIVGTSSISPSHLGRVGVKIILFYVFTSVCAIIIGLFVGAVFAPGVGLELAASGVGTKAANPPSIIKIVLDIIPTNPFGSISSGSVLPTIFFCVIFGIALAFSRDSEDERIKSAAETVFKFFEGMSDVIFRVVGWVMQYAPIGVFALIFIVFSKNGAQAFGPLANVTASLYIGLLLQIVAVYCMICIILKLSPIKFIKKVRLPMLTAFITRSSGATIPVSMDVAEREMGVPKQISSFTIPVGATINMDGTTIYLGVCAIFIANAVGVQLDMTAQTTIVLTAVLASVGTAGVPGAGAIMLLMVLESVGLKVEAGSIVAIAYGMILGIDAILDMGRTSMNVVGDIIGTVAVAKSEDELELSKWK